MKHEDRKALILTAGVEAASLDGYRKLKHSDVADLAGVSSGLVVHHFRTVDDLRDAVVVESVAVENLKIISEALGALHPVALGAPVELREKALDFLRGLVERAGV